MLVGKEFSIKCEQILVEADKISNRSESNIISVEELNKTLNYDRIEIKHLFKYLSEFNYIVIETICGPYLYGAISLTEKGVLKINSTKKKGKRSD